MNVEKHTKQMYNKFGKHYQLSRKEKRPERLFNEYLELPAMVKAVGNIKNKKLLDIGCGAGIHAKKYAQKSAKVSGVDLSKTMVDMAKENCPSANFEVGSITKLPHNNYFFDIVTASLSIDYIDDMKKAFKEVARVLKKGGKFYYSNNSPIHSAREKFENKNIKINGIGSFFDKRTGKRISLGNAWDESVVEWEMVPGMKMKTYNKTFRTQLRALVDNGFELIDFIDLKPVAAFKKYNKEYYDLYTKFPIFSIYVAKKK